MATLLLIEDNQMLLETTTELLEALGHQVLGAANGREAREIMAARGREIELLLLDLSLPDVAGEELLRELAERYAGLRVVICTGDLGAAELQQQYPAVRGFLAKPFDLRNLQDAIAKALAIQV